MNIAAVVGLHVKSVACTEFMLSTCLTARKLRRPAVAERVLLVFGGEEVRRANDIRHGEVLPLTAGSNFAQDQSLTEGQVRGQAFG